MPTAGHVTDIEFQLISQLISVEHFTVSFSTTTTKILNEIGHVRTFTTCIILCILHKTLTKMLSASYRQEAEIISTEENPEGRIKT